MIIGEEEEEAGKADEDERKEGKIIFVRIQISNFSSGPNNRRAHDASL